MRVGHNYCLVHRHLVAVTFGIDFYRALLVVVCEARSQGEGCHLPFSSCVSIVVITFGMDLHWARPIVVCRDGRRATREVCSHGDLRGARALPSPAEARVKLSHSTRALRSRPVHIDADSKGNHVIRVRVILAPMRPSASSRSESTSVGFDSSSTARVIGWLQNSESGWHGSNAIRLRRQSQS